MMKKIILNLVLLGIPYIWKFVKSKWGNKIDDEIETVIDAAVDAVPREKN